MNFFDNLRRKAPLSGMIDTTRTKQFRWKARQLICITLI
jgi:hypothetical protein